jgi:demethylmenaquinone methyltransferase/2-methoxy-6-polyprenyl-1,4-benzoquinol methylase
MKHSDIYDPAFVSDLFSQMSATYDRMNTITSFGFSIRWRRQCAKTLQLQPGMQVVDLMTGMGEAWPFLLRDIGATGHIAALDFCPEMIRFASKRRETLPGISIQLLQEDALGCSLPEAQADAVISTFGLKTFNTEQLERLSQEIMRLLKPGARFALVEVSSPRSWWLRPLYLFYLQRIIPLLGKVFLRNPESYRMLGVYTEAFGDCRQVQAIFENTGFQVQFQSYFGGCATAVTGVKPGV